MSAWASLLTSAVNITMGSMEKNAGEKQKRLAKGYKPPMEDPEMRQYLGYLERKRRAVETGGAYEGLYGQVGRNLANTQNGILQASGGAAGAAILGMQRASAGANQAFGDIVAQQSGDLQAWDNKYGNVLGNIAQRKQDLQLMKYNQEMAEAAAKIKSGDSQMKGGEQDALGGMGGILDMFSKKQ